MKRNIHSNFDHHEHPRRKRDLVDQAASAPGFSEANCINNTGQIVGGSCVKRCSGYEAFLLTARDFRSFGTLGGYASVAFGINDHGDVVGQSDTATVDTNGEFASLAFIADRTGVHNLGTSPGYLYSQAFAINNNGLIIGRIYNSNPEDPSAPMRAVLFGRDGAIRDIGTLGGSMALAFGINDSGYIVGRSWTADGEQHAFLYDGHVMRDLGTLGGNRSTARAINNREQIVGGSRLATPEQRHAFLFERGSMRDLGTLGGSYSEAFAINDAGSIVGESDNASGERHAFLYRDGVMTDLGTLGGMYSAAFSINSRGDIVGIAEVASGDVHAFLYAHDVMRDLGTLP